MNFKNDVNIGIPVVLESPDDFLLVRESLTRMGVTAANKNTLYQTAHILHRRGEYFLCHFKELFLLDGRHSTIDADDFARRNTIAKLLQDWGLLTIHALDENAVYAPVKSIKILPFKEKDKWELVAKYQLGKKT